jgi:hydrogenase maturation protein HypF
VFVTLTRRRFHITGIVQGVGFRPFVYGLATDLGLTGYVRNDARGLVVEVEGGTTKIDAFRSALAEHPPPLAVLEAIAEEDLIVVGDGVFRIEESVTRGAGSTPVSPDAATCAACLQELFDPLDRRYRYPFINCTNCGPRFTIVTSVPYDRANTTMASFEMCALCRAEYDSPTDRRFHAQPIACPECGPRLRLSPDADRSSDVSPLDELIASLRRGAVVAVKGLGGYHLACDAFDEMAVAELRRRKAREEKPLAVMVASLTDAHALAELSPAETDVLDSDRRPIVLVKKRVGSALAPSVSPGDRYVGLMLPYTPLHHLLLAGMGTPLVMTSGNHADEPILFLDDQAHERLGEVADVILWHDRPIRMRCDDSVVRVVDDRVYPIRRSRGLAPAPIYVTPPFKVPVMGAGAQLKHTFCLGKDDRAIVSQHIGDLQSYEAMIAFDDARTHFTELFGVAPEVLGHDLHPDYLSTKWATTQTSSRVVAVQHHHAHIASCLADNGRSDRVLGLALDGTGAGDDGTLWGCELLVCDLAGYERESHLRYVPVPGGEAAIKEPWRMAAVYLDRIFGPGAIDLDLDLVHTTGPSWGPILKMAAQNINSPQASSAGRLFDAVAALCCERYSVTYEGQAAAALEQIADAQVTDAYPCALRSNEIQGDELVAAVVEDLLAMAPPAVVAARFHNGLAAVLADAASAARDRHGLSTVALSGGTFQNVLLVTRTRLELRQRGFEVLVHRQVPPNDGGISLGQAVVANAQPS